MIYHFNAVLVALALALNAAFTPPARAEGLTPDAMGVHLVSVHSKKYQSNGETWNNANPGVYARWGPWVGGVYYNSERRTSAYAGYSYAVTSYLDVVAGVVSGYEGRGVEPMLIPSLHFPLTDRWDIRFNLAVGVKQGSATAINLALEYRL